ncbi:MULTISPECIES: hypothetical protein [unclassified Rathayibacter]|uniref:hypothetical protein n=1 Tax=unclassified Rathayibacter TaxID=2609250 RepID=UPI0010DFA030|nr:MULTISPECIES: hypothetical protein [unclassified Rathayibacter]TCL77875.1 uncharacterized protein with FMN-binding domain [Rathayibacter sp. PhB192]TCM23782.1 uncharacterized protein with FMN-binding domain [Rathayibacter sp. PhB179]
MRGRLAAAAGTLTVAATLTGCTAGDRAAEDPATTPAAAASAAPTLQQPERSTSTPEASTSTPEAEGEYRDGEYTARGWYGGLPSHHDVTLTIQGDAVTAVAITTPAEDETSLGYQQRFAEALPQAIVGRPIDELDVDRLAGSSGCSEGFMDALAQIRDQAAA